MVKAVTTLVGSILFLITFLSMSAVAAKPKSEIYSHKRLGAIKGVDVVAYFSLEPGAEAVKGKKAFTYTYKDANFIFATQENLNLFAQDPEKYIPQYGGYCAFAISKNFITSIRPNSWKIVDGKLYLNHNSASFKLWKKKQDERIALADKNWPSVLTK